MPKLFTVSGYNVFFWSNEQGEPIHVHVSKGRPAPNATKIWLTRTGGCIVANNGSKIPEKELSQTFYSLAVTIRSSGGYFFPLKIWYAGLIRATMSKQN